MPVRRRTLRSDLRDELLEARLVGTRLFGGEPFRPALVRTVEPDEQADRDRDDQREARYGRTVAQREEDRRRQDQRREQEPDARSPLCL